LSINRGTFYYKPKQKTATDNEMMQYIENIHIQRPALGYRKIQVMLCNKGIMCNHKKVLRLMHERGICALLAKPKTTHIVNDQEHKKYAYLLKNLHITRPNQVWAVDITYIKIRGGYVYLFGIIDIFSRKIIGWKLSPFLTTEPCIDSFESVLLQAFPKIVNSDQGCQFTSEAWRKVLLSCGIKISMDGKGRWADNIYIERFWKTFKYEFAKFYHFETLEQLQKETTAFIDHYNNERPHQSLDYKTPEFVYTTGQGPITKPSQYKSYSQRKRAWTKELLPVKEKEEDFLKNIGTKIQDGRQQNPDLVDKIMCCEQEVFVGA
jgi:putative transposase